MVEIFIYFVLKSIMQNKNNVNNYVLYVTMLSCTNIDFFRLWTATITKKRAFGSNDWT